MSTNEISFASPPCSTGSPTNTPACTGSRDTEMTCLLTSTETDSSRSRSSSPKKAMSYQNSRDRGERYGSSRPSGSTSGRSSINPGAMTHWRREETPYIGGNYHQQAYYCGAYDPHSPMMVDGYVGPPPQRNRRNSIMTGEASIPLGTVVPGWAYPSNEQLDTAYGYAFRRPDGYYTRLIPADTLMDVDVQNIQRRQGPEGLIVVPQPRQLEPSIRQGPEVMIPGEVSLVITSSNWREVYT
jgi:hypothetical protein